MRLTSAPDCASSCASTAASFVLSEPDRSDPGITRIFSADILKSQVQGVHPGAGRSTLAIHPDPRRRKVHPDPLRGLCGHAGQRLRNRGRHRIGELDEGRAGRESQEGVADQLQAGEHRLGDQRQAGDHGRRRRLHDVPQRVAEPVGVALHDLGLRIAFAQQR
ncbi:hypothetical protein chiPu_0033208, partial [Chiloscyllium punctatum]|nr:hypothetical protein [Chiloscyllium punctatum]